MKIIITENQLKLINEAVGVPKGIMQAGEELYEIVLDVLKTINENEIEYEFDIEDKELQISDITIDHIKIIVEIQEVEDYDGKPEIASMGVSNEFNFDNAILMQISPVTKTLILHINFVTGEIWEPEEILEKFQEDEVHTISVMTHELKHKYDRTKKTKGFVGDIADYQTYSSGRLNFGIPILNKFMRYSYFIQMAENLVRPTEISTRMLKKGITKEQLYDFITNDIAYKELQEIRNFSFDYLMENLYNEMDVINRLLEHASGYSNLIEEAKNFLENECGYDLHDINLMSEEDIVNALHDEGNDELAKKIESLLHMDDDAKIKMVLKLVYVNLANAKVDTFDNYFYSQQEKIDSMFGGLMSQLFGGGKKINPDKEKVREKFINHVTKYQNREIDFFKDECERFNYVATKLMKKISKIYSLIPDEKEQTNESILNWDLHQKLMEKKYGKRPIQTSYNFKK